MKRTPTNNTDICKWVSLLKEQISGHPSVTIRDLKVNGVGVLTLQEIMILTTPGSAIWYTQEGVKLVGELA